MPPDPSPDAGPLGTTCPVALVWDNATAVPGLPQPYASLANEVVRIAPVTGGAWAMGKSSQGGLPQAQPDRYVIAQSSGGSFSNNSPPELTPTTTASEIDYARLYDLTALPTGEVWAIGWTAKYDTSTQSVKSSAYVVFSRTLTTAWTTTPIGWPYPGTPASIWAAAPNDVYSCGDDGSNPVLQHFNGAVWTTVTLPADATSANTGSCQVGGSGSSNVWVMLKNGLVRGSGSTWNYVSTPQGLTLLTMAATNTEGFFGARWPSPDPSWLPPALDFDGTSFALAAVAGRLTSFAFAATTIVGWGVEGGNDQIAARAGDGTWGLCKDDFDSFAYGVSTLAGAGNDIWVGTLVTSGAPVVVHGHL